ncbi:MAG: holo-ACP synthase [Luteococcus japonicus]
MNTGVDLVDVGEVADALEHFGERYLRRIHRAEELTGHDGHSPARRAQHFAGRFAAKEAVFKALHFPSDRALPWTDIQIISTPGGWPGVALHDRARTWASSQGISQVELSITHDRTMAMAFAVAV